MSCQYLKIARAPLNKPNLLSLVTNMASLCKFLMAVCLLLIVTPSSSVVVSNVLPRVDSHTGDILELGDGSLHKFGDKYYLYGVKYVCTPSPHTPLFYGCPKKDRRIWGNMSIGVASSPVSAKYFRYCCSLTPCLMLVWVQQCIFILFSYK